MLRVLECFAGIGACSKALTNLGIEYEIVDAIEIDKYAIKSFNAIHNTSFEPQDITKWNKNIECDILLGGFPCQDISVAGKQAGIIKGETRSGLMYEMMRIIAKLKPKYVIAENVKNILSKKHKPQLDEYIRFLETLGYHVSYQVLDSKDYGIPQHRERCFIVAVLEDDKFVFPEPILLDKSLKDMLEDEVDQKYYLTESNIKTINRNFGSKGKILDLGGFSVIEKITYPSRINQKKDEVICPTLVSAMGTGGGNVPVINKYDDRLRKLTPKECWRLQGFSANDFIRARDAGISDTQLYKQAGNSITVNVLMAIFKELFKDGGQG